MTIDDLDLDLDADADVDADADANHRALAVTLHFDTHVIAPEAVEELAWGIERAAVEAAADGHAPTGIRRTPDRRAP